MPPYVDDVADPVTLLARRLPAWLERHTLVLRPGETREVSSAEWPRTFVVLEHGMIELKGQGGHAVALQEGASFSPPPTDSLTIRVTGNGQAVLAIIGRRPEGKT